MEIDFDACLVGMLRPCIYSGANGEICVTQTLLSTSSAHVAMLMLDARLIVSRPHCCHLYCSEYLVFMSVRLMSLLLRNLMFVVLRSSTICKYWQKAAL